MLAPYVTDLLFACTLLLLAGWAQDVMTRWVNVAGHADSAAASGAFDRHGRFDRDAYNVCGLCGLTEDWLFKMEHPERN